MKHILSTLFFTSSLLTISANVTAKSELNPETAYDCTMVQIAEIDPSKLTKAEQIALLEQSLFDSVDQYSNCIDQVQTSMANASSANGGGSGSGSGAGGGTGQNASQGGASGANQGSSQVNQGNDQSQVASQQNNNEQASDRDQSNSGGGAKNQVIAPKDNDSIVCTMLYEEIQRETEQATKEGLMEQYKSYNCG